jgi:hypothetical protein
MTTNADAEEGVTTLESIAGVIAYMGGPQAFQPEYNWSPYAIAEVLADQEEQVFNYRGAYLITTETAEKLKAFLQDFLIQD